MKKRTRPTHSAAFEAKVALAAARGGAHAGGTAQQFEVHPNQITEWKRQLQEREADVFGAAGAPVNEPPVDLKTLHANIGQLALENDSLPLLNPQWVVWRVKGGRQFGRVEAFSLCFLQIEE